jgi:ankyrin repeat protein
MDTPQHLALQNGHTEVARLVDSSAEADLVNDMDTPFHCAEKLGDLNLVKLLLEKVSIQMVTPLYFDVQNRQVEVALLLRSGANATLVNVNKSTRLHVAVRSGYLDPVELLWEKGVDPNTVDKWKNTPIYLAADKGHPEAARLLEGEPDVTLAVNKFGHYFSWW